MPIFRRALLKTANAEVVTFKDSNGVEEIQTPAREEIALLHVRWSAAADASLLHSLRPTLSTEELRRADRFRVVPPRHCFILSWGILRQLLGSLTGKQPAAMEFTFGPQGKPYLAGAMNPDCLQFNLSHSGEDILFAITREREIGVDIEKARERSRMERIAQRHYHPNEICDLKQLEEPAFVDRFYEYWTLKEAWIKALGHGLRYPISTLDFSRLLQSGGGRFHLENADWWCHPFELAPGMPAAMATKAR